MDAPVAPVLAIVPPVSDIDNMIGWWLTRCKPTTQAVYGCFIPKWVAWLETRGIAPLFATRAHVELYLRDVANSGKAAATVANHYLAPIASLYKFLHEEEVIERDPCERVRRPKVHYELQHREVLGVLEYAAFLGMAKVLGPNHHAIAVLGDRAGSAHQ